MKYVTAGRAVTWTTAISVAAVAPRALPVALAAALTREVFDLLRARADRTSVLAYLQGAGAGTYLRVGPSPAGPGVVLSIALGDAASSGGDAAGDPGAFCVAHRADWLAYAAARTRSWADAEDAVSHVVQKILEEHARSGRLCPDDRDPVAWSKKVIANYLIDRHRRQDTQRRLAGPTVVPAADVEEDIVDQIIATKALAFVASLESRAHVIAMMRWVDGLEPRDIAQQLGMNPRSVRSSLHRTRKRMRAELGIAGPRKILREGTT
jgi:RNA polymerase sigma factor (sigma-70 family)